MLELIRHDIKINWMGRRHLFLLLPALLTVWSFYVFFSKGESVYGTDFSGGYEFLVTFEGDFDTEKVRTGLAEQKLEEVRVQAFKGASKEYSIRLGDQGDPQSVRTKVESALKAAFGDAAKIQKTDYVGPTVGKELRKHALLAIGLGLLGILIYIAFRFEFSVAVGNVVALFHDVIISTGIYLAAGHQISMATLAGALTIVGYSVNDTVVIFDRVREERARHKSYNLIDVVNEALNFTLSRTVITHMLTFFSALALYIIGGGEIAELSFYLCAGIICGSYSTIFIVAPIVILWEHWRGTQTVDAPTIGGAAHAKKA
jgi:preprotein translocase subunit SecF